MRREVEIIEHTKITRILESTDEEPPEECTCTDCGEIFEAIEKPRLAIAAGRR